MASQIKYQFLREDRELVVVETRLYPYKRLRVCIRGSCRRDAINPCLYKRQ
jgi:hypothetical protein